MHTGNLIAGDFDARAQKVVPCYLDIHKDVLDLVGHAIGEPRVWLDTGCGTGTLVSKIIGDHPETQFILADPSRDMLDIAEGKVEGNVRFLCGTTDSLDLPDESVDVITAVLCHHYYQRGERIAAERNCFRMLRKGGLFVTVEHTAPDTEDGLCIALSRWKDMQVAAGRSEEEAEEHLTRYGREFFPITASEHLAQLNDIGFRAAEMFRRTYVQSGFYAIK